MTEMLELVSAKRYQKHKKPTSSDSLETRSHHRDEKLSRSEFYKIIKTLMQKAFSKMDRWTVDVAEQTGVGAIETCDPDHDKAFIKGALKSAPNELCISIMNDFPRI